MLSAGPQSTAFTGRLAAPPASTQLSAHQDALLDDHGTVTLATWRHHAPAPQRDRRKSDPACRVRRPSAGARENRITGTFPGYGPRTERNTLRLSTVSLMPRLIDATSMASSDNRAQQRSVADQARDLVVAKPSRGNPLVPDATEGPGTQLLREECNRPLHARLR